MERRYALIKHTHGYEPEYGSWTAVIGGSSTAGTYQIGSQDSRYVRIGRLVFLNTRITMAGVVTGGGAGSVQITGMPFTRAANTSPIGSVLTTGVDFGNTGASLAVYFASSTALAIYESVDNASGTNLSITGVGANDQIFLSIVYETDDE